MRKNSSAVLLVILVMVSLLTPLGTNATDSTISTDITWSGQHTLTGNVTIVQGTTLTVEPGASIDCGDDYWILVEGTLVVNGAHFYSSAPPVTQGSHGAGLWKGIEVSSGGNALLNETLIENAKTALKINGQLQANDLQIKHSYIGVNNLANSSIVGYRSHQIDYDSIQNSGVLSISQAQINQSAVGIHSTGITTVVESNFSSIGIAINAPSGDISAQYIHLETITVGILGQSSSKIHASEITGNNISLLVDAGNSDDLLVSNVVVSGDRALVSNQATSFEISNISFSRTTTHSSPLIDQNCVGLCVLKDVSLSGSANGIFLSGVGTHKLENIDALVTESAIEATGAGHLSTSNISITTSNNGIKLRGPSSQFMGHTTVIITQSNALGIDVLDSLHTWSEVVIKKQFNQQDTSSLGINAWYAEIACNVLKIENLSTGINLQDSEIIGSNIQILGGTDTAVELKDSRIISNDISTKYQAFGIQMHDQSYLRTNQWTAELHNSPLKLFNNSYANIRQFVPLNTNSNSFDASGDGTILYGGSSSITISTTEFGIFEETTVQFNDISGNAVQAVINVNDFQIVCDENGYATLPLLSQGSEIEAIFSSTGVTQILFGGQPNQVVQIPVIPTGDWTINSGQSVILGPRPDGESHIISGDLKLLGDSSLKVVSSSIEISSGSQVLLFDQSQIIGDNAVIRAPGIEINSLAKLTSLENSQLVVESPVNWSCSSTTFTISLLFKQALELQPNCDIEMLGGSIDSSFTIPVGSSFTQLSALELVVLDKGNAVEGALISINGTNELTDSDGRVSVNATARFIDATSDNVGGLQNITLQVGTFSDFVTWDSSSSFHHTFIASRIDSGILTENMVLESKWSPYYLEGELEIPQLKTLKIDDGVSFRISEGVNIVVNGSLDAGESTLSSTGFGARWGGLILGDYLSSRIELSNTDIVEAFTPLYVASAGTLFADGVSVMRSTASEPLLLVEPSSSASVEIKNSQFRDGGSGCIELYQSDADIEFSNLDMSYCNGPAVWARQTEIFASNITIGVGIESGFDLTEVSGTISSVDATQFSGTGNVVWLDSMDEGFKLENLHATSGQSAAIAGRNNRNIQLDSLVVEGAPAIDFDTSAGLLSNIQLIGPGSGNGLINHHGRSSSSMVFENLLIQNYSVGVDLHSDEGETTSPAIIRNSIINSSTSISAENYSVLVKNSNLTGQSELSDDTIIDYVDTRFSVQSPLITWNNAQVNQLHTLQIDSQLNGVSKFSEYNIITVYSNGATFSETVSGVAILQQILISSQSSELGQIELSSLQIVANTPGLPEKSVSLETSYQWSIGTNIVIELTENNPPEIEFIEPIFGQQIMQQTLFTASVNVSDDIDSISLLNYQWTILDSQNNQIFQINSSTSVQNISVPSPGMYILQVEVFDTLGKSNLVSQSFESIPLDSDGDNTVDCDQNSWFDLKIGRSCGPDIYDEDDDNDGFSDSRDAWPLDACAWQDTDNDQQPDEINCPSGITTVLIEDQDDDGDGIPDVLEGQSDDESGTFDTFTMLILVIIAIIFVLFVRRMRQGGGGTPENDYTIE